MKTALVLLLTLLAAPAPTPVDKIFAAGETLDYSLTWLRITGGNARMTIAPVGTTRFKMTSVAVSRSGFARIFKVRDEISSTVSAGDFSTLEYTKNLNERGNVKHDHTVIDEVRKTATRARPNKKTELINVTLPIFDPLSLVYHLRSLDLAPGRVHRFTVYADGKVYTLVATVLQRETLKTEAGTFKCVTVEPKMQGGGLYRDDDDARLLISYTDDERHIPVRIQSEVKVGTITATLRSVKSGVTSTEPGK